MVNRPEIPHLLENDFRRFASAARPRPFAIDPWVASSLLQKAIRRGDVDLAERAAFTLSRHRGQGICRRLIAIAFEDVGVGSVDALIQTTTACTSAAWRLRAGGDELALRIVVRRLAEAPKDRSPDHLICAAHDHPTLEEDRREVGAMSLTQRIQSVAETTSSLPTRAIAAWYASGVEWGKERRIGHGDLGALMGAFHDLGVPSDLVSATQVAAIRTREPIVVMTPLLWLASEKTGGHRVVDCPLPPVTMIGEVPSYALDKHTALGKAAIQRFARECPAVRDALAAHVPDYRANDAACMAAFYADAAPVARRFDWNGSPELERLGIENDMLKVGVARGGVSPVLEAVRDNLEQLNAIRAQVIGRARHGR
jgi:MgsA AAA+ ATPase C terminal